jgi:hypothetical protein
MCLLYMLLYIEVQYTRAYVGCHTAMGQESNVCYACMRACMHACMHACMYVCMYVCYIYIYTHIYIYKHICVSARRMPLVNMCMQHIYMLMCTCIHARNSNARGMFLALAHNMHVCMHIYTHTHAYMCTCSAIYMYIRPYSRNAHFAGFRGLWFG